MEIVATFIALYLIAKIGWLVIKFFAIIVAIGMLMKGCS